MNTLIMLLNFIISLFRKVKAALSNRKVKLSAIFFVIGTCGLYAQVFNRQATITIDYLLYQPEGYHSDTLKKWPTMIYLHGANMGKTFDRHRRNFPARHLENDMKLPFICVIPICKAKGWEPTILNYMLDDVISKFRIDEDKIYLTGASMGGFGTWKWLVNNPERFAAGAPVAGWSEKRDSVTAWKLRNMPIWVFHSEDDKQVSIQPNIEMVNELRKYSTKVKFTIYDDVGHKSSRPTYLENPVIYDWFATQNRKNNLPEAVLLDPESGSKYAGYYLLGNDTLTINCENGNFIMSTQRGRHYNLLVESELIFSLQEDPQRGMMFQIDNGVIQGFYTIKENKQFAKKLIISDH